MSTFLVVILALASFTLNYSQAAIRGNADSFVQFFNISTDCMPNIKNARKLRTGAAVFYFEEAQIGNMIGIADFMCHYELETINGYGFHVYFDEMYLNDQGSLNESPCTDYVQFGRDVIFVDTHRSPKYCGVRTTNSISSNGSRVFTGGQGSRMYVEEKDWEMDVWIKISRRRSPEERPRQLKMTVTVIKKDCGDKNPFYRHCSNTHHCVRREFFCDGRVNCAWPDAEYGGTDEVNCDAEEEPYRGPFNTKGAANIPLVIVMIIIGTAFIVVILVFGKKFVSIFCKSNDLPRSNNELSNRNRRGRGNAGGASAAAATEATPDPEPNEDTLLNRPQEDAPLPTAPPSYDEVIKDNPGILSRGVPLAPPPYSESLTMTQV